MEEKTEYLERQKAEITKKNKDLKTAQIEIEQKAKELEITSKYKSEFLANMSHELRTPLNSLLILSRDLSNNTKGNLTDKQMESAEIIYNSGTDLLELINEILDLSKIEAGKMTLNIGQVELKNILISLKKNFNAQVTQKGLKLKLDLDKDLPEAIQTDQQRLEQIIKNLLSNSIKFTRKGSITVKIHRPELDAKFSMSKQKPRKTVAISVIDTGIGIPEEKQSKIFEAFQQADGSTSRKYGGTGLGLSISLELSKLLGGELHLKSKTGEGSTFTVSLPEEYRGKDLETKSKTEISAKQEKSNKSSSKNSEPKLIHGNGSPRRKDLHKKVSSIKDDRDNIKKSDNVILMIEDDLAFARTIYKFCEVKDFKFLHAADGETGLQMVEKYKPDAIILDINLPGIDGWSVLETLKENSHTRHIPVHMMSVSEQSIDAFAKGAMGYLTKPVSKEQLDEAFNKMENLYSKKIKDLLVVEDDKNMRKTIVGLVGENGVKVTTTREGKKALSELKSKSYDCMILDLGLPDISGFEVLKRMNNMKDVKVPPVIVYTGRDITREEEYELKKHAKSIIVKGVKSEERLLDETALFMHQVIDELPESKKKMISMLHNKEALFEGKKILIVDDDMRNVFAVSKILEDKNMEVVSAANGEKALELLNKDPKIDLILMDIMMPVMDGYETMKKIRSQEDINNIPIIALTAKAMKGDRDKCIEAGANDYLAKPIDIEKLFSLMRVWLYK